MSDFIFVPSYDTSGSDKFAELTSQFGDGYVQSMPDGLNPVLESWKLFFDGITVAEMEEIRTFFRERAGQTFTWTRPGGTEKRYRRTGEVEWRRVGPTCAELSVTIEESFGT